MRYFVTGATGFIGSHLCRHLAEQGDTIYALVRTPAKAAGLPEGTNVIAGDLGLFADPSTVLPEVDVVVHLAGVVQADTPAQYEAINFAAVADLISCLQRQTWQPRRLLFASSLAAAGPSAPGRPWTETDPLSPIEPYGDAKARAEALMKDVEFPTTVFRPPIVLGAGDPATLTLYQAARRGVGMKVARQPQQLSWVDVRDLVDAIALMAADTRPGRHTYFTSHPDAADIDEIWQAMGRAFDRRVVTLPIPKAGLYAAMRISTLVTSALGVRNQLDDKQYRQLIARAFVCSSAALREDLGWRPQHDLLAATRDAVAGYRATGTLPPASRR